MVAKITIIGWYGTETIGDRAILSGIFTFFKKAFREFEVKLGSLYPFFTQRTLNEDHNFWEESCNYTFPVQLFDSKKVQELDKAIKDSDLVVMGGGPLMHIEKQKNSGKQQRCLVAESVRYSQRNSKNL
jgi:polysaccharide pyruvyl transferase WcaK-like protein